MGIPTVDRPDDANARDPAATDGLLLGQFVDEGRQDAFAALLRRHGPYIFAVCRRRTYHAEDAEDVFQATFLELVRRGRSITRRCSVVGWLHTVAVRLARKAVARRAQRTQVEAATAMPEATVLPTDLSWREACRILDEEVERLPEKLRSVLILCLHQGQTQEAASRSLGIKPRLVKDRLRRARDLLRQRLTGRGVSLAVLGTLLAGGATEAAVPAALQQATLQGATALANNGPLAGIVSPGALALLTPVSPLAGLGLPLAILLGLLLFVGAAYLAWVASAPPRAARAPLQLKRSFQGGQFDDTLFEWIGPDPEKYVRREEEGLRITLPAELGPGKPVGLKLRFPVRGDFEIAATVEIMPLKLPPSGRFSGVDIYFLLDSPRRDAIFLGKRLDVKAGSLYFAGQRYDKGAGRATSFTEYMRAPHETGLARLRAVRQGAQFSFAVADGPDGDYVPFIAREVHTADLRTVRFAADPSEFPDAPADVRLVDLSITAQDIVGYQRPSP